ncbi:response regulator [Thalassomonas actiniarum]|uniref:Response regulator n=1 Tax=Thalassomonas actiniarum TaxID=485447 RepID=A0AAE9YUB6_9GAMM|nr:response regulator [Thalassomonas actiniarum]WDD99776.1 response regulator [Thalassomonas actiniarum]
MSSILLVEDDQVIRKMISIRLQLRGFEVDTAVNGEQGVEKASTCLYDAILMDMHMPVMDGHEATKVLRKQGYQGLIIAVTASVMSEETNKAINIGCDHFIPKPIEVTFEDQVTEFITRFKAG